MRPVAALLLALAWTPGHAQSELSFYQENDGYLFSSEEVVSTGDIKNSANTHSLEWGLDLCHDSAGAEQLVLVCIQSVTLAADATVTNTYAYFAVQSVSATSSASVTVRIRGEAAAAGANPSETNSDISSRSTTSAYVDWTPDAAVENGYLRTPDLSAIVTEIVAISGWASGNRINLIFSHQSGSGTRTLWRAAPSWSCSPGPPSPRGSGV